MIVGPVYKIQTEEGSVLATRDAYDQKYILWGAYDRVTFEECTRLGEMETLLLSVAPPKSQP